MITLDIDDSADTVHGHQQLSLFNAHYDERCFLPIHVYDAATGHCVMTILRPGKTPDGKEICAHLHRLVRRIRLHWPDTRITIRGDEHYGRREAMDWCDQTRVHYIFGLSSNAVLAAQVFAETVDVCVRRATANLDLVRDYTRDQLWRQILVGLPAASWRGSMRDAERPRCPLCRYQHYIRVPPNWLYDSLYCVHGGRRRTLIKRHKSQPGL